MTDAVPQTGRISRLRDRWAAQRTPDDVRQVVTAATGERLLTWGRDDSGEPVVATDAGLWAYGERLAWTEIDHVDWAEPTFAIRAIDGETREVTMGDARDLPAMIRTKVEASVLASVAVPLDASGRGATIVARRVGPAEVSWQVRYDAGVPRDDPAFRERIDEVLAAMRTELGI